MSRGSLTTTSYAILGLLAIQPWSTYELARQMERSLGRFWPRAESKLYEEPKKLVARGLARASSELTGQRRRTVYSITPAGRQALAAWLTEPGRGPVLEFEQLLKVFFSENGSKQDTLATLSAARGWARTQLAESLAVGQEYLAGQGPFPQRGPQRHLTVRFLNDFYALVGQWAKWAIEVVEDWPEDPRAAQVAPEEVEEIVRSLAAALAEEEPA